jgi:DNA polymerase-1
MSSLEIDLALYCCKDRLFQEVRSKDPTLVVALGNTPLELLTGEPHKIRSVSGKILPGKEFPVLPVIHPASLIRRYEEFPDFVDALRTAPRYLKGTYKQAAIPHTTIVDKDNFAEVLDKLDKADLLAVDLETTGRGFYPYGREPDKIRCIVLATDSSSTFIVPGESSPYYKEHPNFAYDDRLKDILHRKKCIYHNGPFDIGFLKQAGYDVEIFFDTFLAHYLLDEREYSHGLKLLAQKFLGAPNWEDALKVYLPNRNSSYDLVPDDKLYEYAAYDVAYTYQLSEEVGFRSKVSNIRAYKDILLPCANMFSKIRHKGIPIDIDYLMELDGVLERELEEELQSLREMTEVDINPFSPKEVGELLYDVLGLPPVPGYGRSTAAKVLNIIGGPVCQKIIEIREFGKLKSTYVVGVANFVDKNFRIHPFTKLHGTVTGRISTTDPNVMNVHKKGGVRKLYLPEPGHMILEADQKQVELRCYAVVGEDQFLRDLIISGDDPHKRVQDDLERRTNRKWDRDKAKAGVFGRLYGRGKRDFIESYNLSERDADELIASIDRIFPSIKQYNATIKQQIHNVGYLESFFGRKRRFGLVIDENKHELYRQGANFLIQSMASDINLLCMLKMWEEKDKLGIYPLFPVHDSIVMDVEDTSIIPTIKKEIEAFTKEIVNGKMEFRLSCSVGPNWGDTQPFVGA